MSDQLLSVQVSSSSVFSNGDIIVCDKQICTSDGPGTVFPNGNSVLHGTSTPPLFHYPPFHRARGKQMHSMIYYKCISFLLLEPLNCFIM